MAASCAVPGIFRPIRVRDGSGVPFVAPQEPAEDEEAVEELEGILCADGGAVDRTAYRGWRKWRPEASGLVHLVSDLPSGQHGPRDGVDGSAPMVEGIIRTPRAKASFLSLRDFDAQVDTAMAQASEQLLAM